LPIIVRELDVSIAGAAHCDWHAVHVQYIAAGRGVGAVHCDWARW
jgi:hypothetical protein